MSNAHIINCISDIFIYNEYILSISNMTVWQFMNDEVYNPNKLHSSNIIQQSGIRTTLFIYDCNLIGSRYGLNLLSGSATIIKCSFQQSRMAIILRSSDEFFMQYSDIKNNGQYNGPLMDDAFIDMYIYAGFQAAWSSNIILENNTFSGFDPRGLIYFLECSTILLQNNIINVDISGLYYNISSKFLHFDRIC